jgi:two-component system, response regulator / RNA-binding antiterminator
MLNILLVESGVNSDRLASALNGEKQDFLKIQYGPSFFKDIDGFKPDVIIITVDKPCEKLISDLCRLDRHAPLPVIIFSNDGCNETINKVIQAEVSAYIVDGLPCQRLNSIVQVAIATFKHRQGLKLALEEARTQLEDRKQIDRAKAILIKTQNITEDEAYHTLRKIAMDRKITLGETSRNVIALATLLK